jgi:hypothetical protein
MMLPVWTGSLPYCIVCKCTMVGYFYDAEMALIYYFIAGITIIGFGVSLTHNLIGPLKNVILNQ